MSQSKRSKEIADAVISWYETNNGYVPNVICVFGHPDMAYQVLESIGYGVSKQNADYGWGTRHRRNTRRINNALKQDPRFKKCWVRAMNRLVGFDYLPNKEREIND